MLATTEFLELGLTLLQDGFRDPLSDQTSRHPISFTHLNRQGERVALLLLQASEKIQRLSVFVIKSRPDLKASEPINALFVPSLKALELEKSQIGDMQSPDGHELSDHARALVIGRDFFK